jgi:hypothetical protein
VSSDVVKLVVACIPVIGGGIGFTVKKSLQRREARQAQMEAASKAEQSFRSATAALPASFEGNALKKQTAWVQVRQAAMNLPSNSKLQSLANELENASEADDQTVREITAKIQNSAS